MAGDAGAAVDLTHVDQDGTHARTKTQLWGGVEESIADCSPVGLVVVVVVCGQPGLRCSRRSWGWCWRCGPGRRPGCETWYSSTHRPRGSSASVGPPSTHMTTERRGRKLAGCGWMAGQRAAAVTVLLMGVCGDVVWLVQGGRRCRAGSVWSTGARCWWTSRTWARSCGPSGRPRASGWRGSRPTRHACRQRPGSEGGARLWGWGLLLVVRDAEGGACSDDSPPPAPFRDLRRFIARQRRPRWHVPFSLLAGPPTSPAQVHACTPTHTPLHPYILKLT